MHRGAKEDELDRIAWKLRRLISFLALTNTTKLSRQFDRSRCVDVDFVIRTGIICSEPFDCRRTDIKFGIGCRIGVRWESLEIPSCYVRAHPSIRPHPRPPFSPRHDRSGLRVVSILPTGWKGDLFLSRYSFSATTRTTRTRVCMPICS